MDIEEIDLVIFMARFFLSRGERVSRKDAKVLKAQRVLIFSSAILYWYLAFILFEEVKVVQILSSFERCEFCDDVNY